MWPAQVQKTPGTAETDYRFEQDLEKSPGVGNVPYEDYNSNGAVPGETLVYGHSLYARVQRWAAKLNIEQRGIERVPEDERTDTSYVNIGSMVCLQVFNCALFKPAFLMKRAALTTT